MKARVLHLDLALAQGSVLYLRRERMRDRIAENPKSDRRIYIARRLGPIFKIGKCVTLGGALFFHCCGVEDTTARLIRLLVSRDYDDGFD